MAKNNIEQFIKTHEVKLLGKRYLTLKGMECRTTLYLSSRDSIEAVREHLPEDYNSQNIEDFNKHLFNASVKYLVAEKERNRVRFQTSADPQGLEQVGIKYDYENLYLFDIDSRRRIYVNNSTMMFVHVSNDSTFLEQARNHFPDKETFQSWKAARMFQAQIGFNPETSGRFYKSPVSHQMMLNRYEAPRWRIRYQKDDEFRRKVDSQRADVYKKVQALLDHLIIDGSDQVALWLYKATFKRSNFHLLLHGNKGTGKTTLATLMLNLVGTESSHIASAAQMSNDFDSSLKNKVLYFWDELDYSSKKAKNKLKKYINQEFAVDQKYTDSHDVEKIYASHIICNNNVSDNWIEVDDRVFLVPDLTDKNLLEIWSEEEIEHFVKVDVKDDFFLACIGQTLYERFHHNYIREEKIIGKTYLKLVNETADYYWKVLAVSLCKEKKVWNMMDLQTRYKDHTGKGNRISIDKIIEYFNKYESYLGIKLADFDVKNSNVISLVYEG